MRKCPITYEPCGHQRYSPAGLALLSTGLTDLKDLPFTAQEQRREAIVRSAKMSIQGVQPKLSAKLSVKHQQLEIVDRGGTFILKPQNDLFPQVPENEDLTMKMAATFGIAVPLTGLVYAKDGSFSYFIKRFDRYGNHQKRSLEDFAQLTDHTRATKYQGSIEKLVSVIEQYCTFPDLEKRKLFQRVLFCFITGNEDMHLKNFSLITLGNIVELSPAYDLLSSTIAIEGITEEMALPLAGKKSKINRKLLIEYYGKERMQLSDEVLLAEMQHLQDKKAPLEEWINKSFLDEEMKKKYRALLAERYARLSN